MFSPLATALIIVSVTMVIAIMAYSLSGPDRVLVKREIKEDDEVVNNKKENLPQNRLSVVDGIKFGFGFGIGMFLWLAIVSVVSIFLGGVLIKSLLEGLQIF